MSFSKAPRITLLGTNLTMGESSNAGKKKRKKRPNLPIPNAPSTVYQRNAISILETQLLRQTEELLDSMRNELEVRRDNGNMKLEINKLKKKLAELPSPGEKISCPICMDSSKQVESEGWRRMVSTPCGHIFCNVCLHKALNRFPFCPKCRTATLSSAFHPLYFN